MVKRFPFATFMVLAYGLSWFGWLLNMAFPSALWPTPILPFGPLLAAVIVTASTGGWPSVKALLARLVQWRVGLRWYVLALLIPIVVTALSAQLTIAAGASAPTSEQLGQWRGLLAAFPIIILFGGPLGEELGWRGWALPHLEERWTSVASTLILGVFWAGWHLPLFILGVAPWPLALGIMGASFTFTWLYQRTDGSVLIAMLCHAAQNTIGGEYFSRMFTGADSVKQIGFMSALYVVLAVVLVATGALVVKDRFQATGFRLQTPPPTV